MYDNIFSISDHPEYCTTIRFLRVTFYQAIVKQHSLSVWLALGALPEKSLGNGIGGLHAIDFGLSSFSSFLLSLLPPEFAIERWQEVPIWAGTLMIMASDYRQGDTIKVCDYGCMDSTPEGHSIKMAMGKANPTAYIPRWIHGSLSRR